MPSPADTDNNDCAGLKTKKSCSLPACVWVGALKGGSCTIVTPATEAPATTAPEPGCTAADKKRICLKVQVAGIPVCEWAGTLRGGSCSTSFPKPVDSDEWRFKGKKAKACAWTNGRKNRCNQQARVAGSKVTGYVACPATCGDDPSWRFDAAKNGCAWTEGLKDRCTVTSTKNAGDGRKAYEACPVTCAEHYVAAVPL